MIALIEYEVFMLSLAVVAALLALITIVLIVGALIDNRRQNQAGAALALILFGLFALAVALAYSNAVRHRDIRYDMRDYPDKLVHVDSEISRVDFATRVNCRVAKSHRGKWRVVANTCSTVVRKSPIVFELPKETTE